MTRQIFAAEIHFKDVSHHVREKFTGTEKNIRKLLRQLKSDFDEVFVLSTDDKFTLYTVHENILPLTHFFHLKHNLKGYVQFYYNTEESATHLFATASGLLSTVKGDFRILEEIHKSYQWATECGCLGITLDGLLRKATDVGKAVRTATSLGIFSGGVVDTALEVLYNRFESLHQKNFLIVGTGKMAALFLENLANEGIRNIVITGDHYEHALQLAKQFNVKVIKIEKARDLLLHTDIIIGASYQEVKINSPAMEKKESSHQATTPKRFIVDFGIPGNFDQKFSDAFNAEIYNMDDLLRIHQSPLESFGGVERGWSMVMKQSKEFVNVLKQLNDSPVLEAYLKRLFHLHRNQLNANGKRTLKDILLLKKPAKTDISLPLQYKNKSVHVNNLQADNASEVVRYVRAFKKFKFYISEN